MKNICHTNMTCSIEQQTAAKRSRRKDVGVFIVRTRTNRLAKISNYIENVLPSIQQSDIKRQNFATTCRPNTERPHATKLLSLSYWTACTHLRCHACCLLSADCCLLLASCASCACTCSPTCFSMISLVCNSIQSLP